MRLVSESYNALPEAQISSDSRNVPQSSHTQPTSLSPPVCAVCLVCEDELPKNDAPLTDGPDLGAHDLTLMVALNPKGKGLAHMKVTKAVSDLGDGEHLAAALLEAADVRQRQTDSSVTGTWMRLGLAQSKSSS